MPGILRGQNWVLDSQELSYRQLWAHTIMGCELNPGHMDQQPMFLTAGPLLQCRDYIILRGRFVFKSLSAFLQPRYFRCRTVFLVKCGENWGIPWRTGPQQEWIGSAEIVPGCRRPIVHATIVFTTVGVGLVWLLVWTNMQIIFLKQLQWKILIDRLKKTVSVSLFWGYFLLLILVDRAGPYCDVALDCLKLALWISLTSELCCSFYIIGVQSFVSVLYLLKPPSCMLVLHSAI